MARSAKDDLKSAGFEGLADEAAAQFSENLAYEKKRAGMTIEDLAHRAEIHRTQVSLLLNGRRLPRIDTVVKLAGALEIHAGELLDGIVWELPKRSVGRFRRESPQRSTELEDGRTER